MSTDRDFVLGALRARLEAEVRLAVEREAEAAAERVRQHLADKIGQMVVALMAEISVEHNEERLVVEFRSRREHR